jgi:hypothetical protein
MRRHVAVQSESRTAVSTLQARHLVTSQTYLRAVEEVLRGQGSDIEALSVRAHRHRARRRLLD